ncbi:MAG: hypothetical protein IPO27_08825 [Bacteroidetes bacterium]|nr:hypothetical protein [Bacteroidota bacterium]
MKIISFSLLLVLACCSRYAYAAVPHDIHQSMARIEWNAQTGKLTVLVNCFIDDFQLAVMKYHNKSIRPDDDSLMHYCLQYINSAFKIAVDGEKLVLHNPTDAGMSELSIHFKFEFSKIKPRQKLDIYNDLINNIYNDQLNIVQIAVPPNEQMLEFDASNRSQPVFIKK